MGARTCLVTGGAGFIGCNISRALADSFDRVVAVDNLHRQVHPTGQRPSELDPRVQLIEADVAETGVLDAVIRDLRPSAVVNLAAETGTGQSLTESTRHGMVNVVGTNRLLDALAGAEVRPESMVLTSSRAVYGEGAVQHASGAPVYPGRRSNTDLEQGRWDFAAGESIPSQAGVTHPMPNNVYGATKLAQEQVTRIWCESFGVPVTVLRLQNVYGPGQSLTNSYTGVLTLFARLALNGQSIPLYEDGQMLRDFVYIDDVGRAIVAALLAPVSSRLLDIGTGQAATIADAARIIARHFGAPEPQVTGQYRLGDVRHASCDITRTLQELDWSPSVGLQTGLDNLCDWVAARIGTA